MKKYTRLLGSLVIAVGIGAGAAGCGASEAQESESESTTSQLSYAVGQKFIGQLPQHVAMEEGIFAENDLEVELVPHSDGPAMMSSLMGGSVDMAGSAPNIMNPLINSGTDLTALGPIQTMDFNMVELGTEPDATASNYTERIAALKGKDIGVPALGSTYHTFVNNLLEEVGLDPEKDVTYIATGIAPGTAIPALREGQVDVLMAPSPTLADMEEQGLDISVIANTSAGIGGDAQDLIGLNSVMSTSFLEEEPETVEKFCKSMDQALEWMADEANSERMVEIITEFTGVEGEPAEALWEKLSTTFKLDVEQEAWEATGEWAMEDEPVPAYADHVYSCK